jgi:O-antigen/teichoic acid export membrane protein
LSNRVVGVFSTIILARLLVPDDFGLISLAATFQGLIETLSDFGLEAALIRIKDPPRHLYDAAWTFCVLRGVAIAIVVFLSRNWVSEYYAQPALANVMSWLAITAIVNGVYNIGIADFRRLMDFRKDFLLWVPPRLFGTLVTIALAFWLRNYWALVIGLIARTVALVVLSYLMHPLRPRLSVAGWADLFHFSKWLSLYNVVVFISSGCAAFTLGRAVGPASVGVYNLASEVSSLPLTELSGPIRRALYPAFAQVLHTGRDKLGGAFVRGLAMTLCLTLPLTIILSLLAKPIVLFALGTNWVDAIPIVRILVIFASIELCTQQVPQAQIVLGAVRSMALASLAILLLRIAAVIVLTQYYGLAGTAWAMVLASAIQLPVFFRMAMRELKISLADIFHAVWRTVLATAIMAAGASLLGDFFRTTPIPDQAAAVIIATISGVAYLACHILFWVLARKPDGVERELLRLALSSLGKRAIARAPG